MFSHLLSDTSHANAREVIDREACTSWIVRGEETLIVGPQEVVFKTGLQFRHAQSLCKILEQYLNKDATAGGGFVLVQVDDRHDMPADGIRAQHVAKKPSNVTKSVRLVAMNGVIVLGKGRLELLGPEAVELSKPLTN